MRVTVELKGPLALGRGAKHVLEVPETATVRDILARLEVPEKHAGLLALNNCKTTLDSRPGEGDNLVVFPVVAGG